MNNCLEMYYVIQRFADNKGFSLRQIEKLANISNGYISSMKRGIVKKPSVELLTKIANVLDVPLNVITGNDMPNFSQDKEVNELAQFLFANPDYKALFLTCKNVKREDLEFAKNMLERCCK